MKTPEGRLKDEVKKYLDSVGAYWFMPVQTGYGRTTLDFLVCHKGKFIGIETKSLKGKLTARQKLVMVQIAMSEGKAIAIHHIDALRFYFES